MNSAPPPPWDELMKILKLSRKPMESGVDWFDRFTCSSSQPLCYLDFVEFISSPLPRVDEATDQMTMIPRVLLMTSRTRCLLLAFLKLISSRIPARDRSHLTGKLQQVFRNNRDETALHHVGLLTSPPMCRRNNLSADLHQRFGGAMPNVRLDWSRLGDKTRAMMDNCGRQTGSDDDVMPVSDVTSNESMELPSSSSCKKPALKRVSEEQRDEGRKRQKLEVDEAETTFESTADQIGSFAEDVKRMVDKKATEELLTFLTGKSEVLLEGIFSQKGRVEIPESIIISLFEKTDKSDDKLLTLVLRHLVLPHLYGMEKSVNRALLNHCIKLTKNSATFSLLHLLTPLICNVPVMYKAHVSLLVSCTKSMSDQEAKISLLSAVLDRCERDLPDRDIDVIVQFLQNLLDFNLPLIETQLGRLVSFFTLAISDHPDLFALSKLILTFIKKFASKLKDIDILDEIAAVIATMKTSLKKVCETTFQKIAKR